MLQLAGEYFRDMHASIHYCDTQVYLMQIDSHRRYL